MGRPIILASSLKWAFIFKQGEECVWALKMRQKYSSLLILDNLASPSRSLSSCAPSNRPPRPAGLLHKCLVYKKVWEHPLPAWWLAPPNRQRLAVHVENMSTASYKAFWDFKRSIFAIFFWTPLSGKTIGLTRLTGIRKDSANPSPYKLLRRQKGEHEASGTGTTSLPRTPNWARQVWIY